MSKKATESFVSKEENISLHCYLSDIMKTSLIEQEEEVELAKRIRKGDQEALDKLVTSNLRFVVSVAKQYQNNGMSLEDLINEGNLGLIEAAHRFDETKGFKFISYAVWWIKQSILQALAETNRLVRLPLNRVGEITKVNAAMQRLEQKYGRDPSIDEISEELDLSYDKVADAMCNNNKDISIDTPIESDEEEEMCFMDQMQNENASDPIEGLMYESLNREMEDILLTLPEKEAYVLRHYYGINTDDTTSLDDIADHMHLTTERIRQLKMSGIRRIGRMEKMDTLKTYL